MQIIAEYGHVLLIMACLFGFFMAWGVGANDVANAMGTSVGSRALTVRQAVIIAVIMEFAGAYLAGGSVTETIRKGIIDPQNPILAAHPQLLVYGMLSSLLAAGTWLLIASIKGWPVSTTHTIVGAIIGFASVGVSLQSVDWGTVGSIVSSWVISPLLAGFIAHFIFISIQKLILDTDTPFESAKKWGPVYMMLVGFMISMVTLVKGLSHVGLELNAFTNTLLSILIGLTIAFTGHLMLKRIKLKPNRKYHTYGVEKVFGTMMIFTACAMAFAHGSNDVANAIGPLSAVISIIQHQGTIALQSSMPSWILLLGGAGIIIGLITYGYKVMATIGHNITELTPSRGFAAQLAAAATVVFASGTGLPISTTHTLVGAVLGVGLARGISALNLNVIGGIVMSWVITLPAGAVLSIAFFYCFKWIFG